MGIKNLYKYLKSKQPQLIKTMPLASLKGKTVYIDTSCLIYKYMSFTTYYSQKESKIKTISDDQGNKTNHLRGISSMIKYFSLLEIEPVFIMDGDPGDLKAEEVG